MIAPSVEEAADTANRFWLAGNRNVHAGIVAQFGCSRATAIRRVDEARRLGLLLVQEGHDPRVAAVSNLTDPVRVIVCLTCGQAWPCDPVRLAIGWPTDPMAATVLRMWAFALADLERAE